jgi:CBS domain-containing protein
MGRHDVEVGAHGERHRTFMRSLLRDLEALERMLEEGRIESGVRRVGVEQELVLVDERWRPAPLATEILESIDDPRVTTELARFNLEFNLEPLELSGDCLGRLRTGLESVLAHIARAAAPLGARPLLAGILPTIEMGDLGRENIAPVPRYFALNDAISKMRGSHYELRIKGADELTVKHDTVMLEALNTSFQMHYQVGPGEFPVMFNLAQLLAAPVLAAATNSPVLFGKRLWRETRIAIFQQAVDTRADRPYGRDTLARVRFGEEWVEESVLEIFRDDIARFRLLVAAEEEEDALAVLEAGGVPRLHALQLHNSTVYRWNRPCYGITGGKPHLRIENRVLSAGPSVLDELANAAFWFGLMAGGPSAWGNVAERMDFGDVAANFTAAAREGITSQLAWLDGETVPADVLVAQRLLPVAREGLLSAGVDASDVDKALGIIETRVESRHTGAHWLLQSAARMKGQGTRAQRLACLAAATYARQQSGDPVHLWEPASLSECTSCRSMFERVDQYMTTDLFTVQEDELIDLVVSIMDWEKIRHVPVEDNEHNLVGLVSYRKLLRLVADRKPADLDKPIAVSEMMVRDPPTVSPETPTLEAIRRMRQHRVAALPVTKDGRLVGIVTEHDFMRIAERMLEEEPGQGVRAGDGGGPRTGGDRRE